MNPPNPNQGRDEPLARPRSASADARGLPAEVGRTSLPVRKTLPHEIPPWIDPNGEIYFITICCRQRKVNQLCVQPIAARLLESVVYRQQIAQWFAHLWLLMPDHLHTLLSFPRDTSVQRTVAAWKSWTAKQNGIAWQRDFFEHRLRAGGNLQMKADYIRANPARAGLAHAGDLWPFSLSCHLLTGEILLGKEIISPPTTKEE